MGDPCAGPGRSIRPAKKFALCIYHSGFQCWNRSRVAPTFNSPRNSPRCDRRNRAWTPENPTTSAGAGYLNAAPPRLSISHCFRFCFYPQHKKIIFFLCWGSFLHVQRSPSRLTPRCSNAHIHVSCRFGVERRSALFVALFFENSRLAHPTAVNCRGRSYVPRTTAAVLTYRKCLAT